MSRTEPYVISLEKGTHYICQCGQSNNRSFFDGSHQGTEKEPFALEIAKKQEVVLCGCLQSSHSLLCDGSHLQITS